MNFDAKVVSVIVGLSLPVLMYAGDVRWNQGNDLKLVQVQMSGICRSELNSIKEDMNRIKSKGVLSHKDKEDLADLRKEYDRIYTLCFGKAPAQ